MKRKICLLTTLSALTCVCLSAIFVSNKPVFSYLATKGQNEAYQLVFDAEDDSIGRLYYDSGQINKQTIYNNEILFYYSGFKYCENNFAMIKENGYIYNKTPLNGLRNVSIIVDNPNSSFKLYYTDIDIDENGKRFYDYVELNQANGFSYTFMNSYKHFKLVSVSNDVCLNELVVNYECKEITNITNDLYLTYVNEGFWMVGGTTREDLEYVNIPSHYEGIPIKGIYSEAFSNCLNFKKIYIPETIEYLFSTSAPRSSSDCDSILGLHYAIAPETKDGLANFEGYDVHPDNKVLYSEAGVLYNKEQTSLIGVPGVYEGVFTIKEGVIMNEMNAFLGCDKITKIIIPNSFIGLTTNYSAFGYNLALNAFEVGENNRFFQAVDGVLYNKDMTQLMMVPSAMTGKYDIPNTVKTINGYAFTFSQLSDITIPNSVIDIMPYAFTYASNIEYIEIPDSVLTVGWFIFGECTSLKEVVFGDSITRLEDPIFYNCPNLQKITLGKNIDYYDLNNLNIDHELEEIVVKSPCLANISIEDCIEYQNGYYYSFNENPYQCFVDVIDNSVDTIDTHEDCEYVLTDFDGCNNLNSIVFGENVWKFKTIINCSSLTSIEIPSSISLDRPLVNTASVPNLENVYFNGTINDWCNLELDDESANPKSCASNLYVKDNGGSYYIPEHVEVPEGISKIDYHFSNWDQLQSLILNDSICDLSNFNCSEDVFNYYNGAKYLGNQNSDYAYLIDGHNGTENFISNDCIGIADKACNRMKLSEDVDLSNIKFIGEDSFSDTSFTNESVELASIISISPYAFDSSNIEEFIITSPNLIKVGEWGIASSKPYKITLNGANDLSNWSPFFFYRYLTELSFI